MTARVRKVEVYVIEDERDMSCDCPHRELEESAYWALASAIVYRCYSKYENVVRPHRVTKQNDREYRRKLERRLARFLAFADSKGWPV